MFILILATIVSVAWAVVPMPNMNDQQAIRQSFEQFKIEHEKSYDSAEEEQLRFVNFISSLKDIHRMNARSQQLNSTARYGITLFADMSAQEFKTTILMKNKIETATPAEVDAIKKAKNIDDFKADQLARSVGQPTSWDWRKHGLVTRVKNQGQCGSCWAFSATEEIESQWLKAGHGDVNTLELAPQQIVDCDGTSMGCGGGRTESAFNYIIGAGGIESNHTYPYRAVDGQCKFNKNDVVAHISSYSAATSWYSESELKKTLLSHGPVSVCVDASQWQHYKSGVMTRLECAWVDVLDHCVQLTGFDQANGADYWWVRNSWTTRWGIDGYIKLQYGYDTCGIANDANVVKI